MRIGKLTLIGLVLGAMAVGSVMSVSAQTEDPPAAEEQQQQQEQQDEGRRGPRFKGHGGGFHGAIRGQAVVPSRENEGEFVTVRHDRGELTAIDGSTLQVTEADGTVVDIAVGEDTVIRRDREEAELGDLQVGDHVKVMRVREDGADWTTKHVGAISAERYAEMEAQRAEMEAQREVCRENPDAEDCQQQRRGRRGGPGRFGPPPADNVTPDAEPTVA